MKRLILALSVVGLYLSGQLLSRIDPSVVAGPGVAFAQPTTQPQEQKAADEYRALYEKAKKVLKLRTEESAIPPAAVPLVKSLPLPPAPGPGGEPPPTKLKEWDAQYEKDLSKEIGKDQGKGLFQLLGALCKVTAIAYAAPQAAPLCDLALPILDALGLSLGSGDDVQKAAQAIVATQNGDYGPLRTYLGNSASVRDGVGRLVSRLQEIDPKALERLAGIDPRGATCNQLAVAYAQQPAEQRVLLLSLITNSTLRSQVEKGACPSGKAK